MRGAIFYTLKNNILNPPINFYFVFFFFFYLAFLTVDKMLNLLTLIKEFLYLLP